MLSDKLNDYPLLFNLNWFFFSFWNKIVYLETSWKTEGSVNFAILSWLHWLCMYYRIGEAQGKEKEMISPGLIWIEFFYTNLISRPSTDLQRLRSLEGLLTETGGSHSWHGHAAWSMYHLVIKSVMWILTV